MTDSNELENLKIVLTEFDNQRSNLVPLLQTEGPRSAWAGILWVFVTSPLWFSGFQVIPQVMEERAPGTALRAVGQVVLLAIAMALVFYWLVILSSPAT